jgi:hypothetical protein
VSAARVLLALAAVAGAAAAQVPLQHNPPDPGFVALAAGEINAVAAFTPPDFTLAARHEEAQFAFYGKELNSLEGVRCERQAGFEFVAQANLTGSIQVGVCESEAKRVRALATTAPVALDRLLAQLPTIDAKARAQSGLTFNRQVAANGTQAYAFPVMALGHGVLVVQTVVLVTDGARRAIVVQADTHKLCENYGGLKDKTALCRDTRRALTDIARRLEARFTK